MPEIEEERPVQERFVVFLRHSVAQPKSEEIPDRERTLTDDGKKIMKRASRGLVEIFPEADAILSSPYVRCVETALRVAKAYDADVTVRTSDLLVPDASTEAVVSLIQETPHHRLILVGHEPTLTAGMVALTGISAPVLELEKAGCYCVRIVEERAQLVWMLTPKILRKLG